MITARVAAPALLLASAASPGLAASCHMTVQGAPVIDGGDCAVAGRRGDVRVTAGGAEVRIRGSRMSGRFVVRRPPDGRLGRVAVSYGRIIATSDSDDKTCYYNQKATLCIDP